MYETSVSGMNPLKLTSRAEGVAEMVSIGLGLKKDHLNQAGAYGSHLLAPTATNLEKFGQLNSYVLVETAANWQDLRRLPQ